MASEFANKFRYLDIFGQKVILNFHGKSLIQTVFGGIVASCVCALAIIFCYNSTIDILDKVNFIVQDNRIFQDNPSQLNLTNDKFMIAVNMIQDNFINSPYVNITLQQRANILLENGTRIRQTIDIQLEQCTFQHWSALNKPEDTIITQQQFNSYNISNYLCPKLGTNLTVQGQTANEVFQFLRFSITGCQNQTNPDTSPNLWKPVCPSAADQLKYYSKNTIRVQFLFSNYIINPTQVGHFATRYIANDVFFQLQPGYMYTTADIYMTETIISEDTSLYPWKSINNQTLAAQQYGDYRQQYTFGNNTVFGAFFFNRSRFKQIYAISYEKFDSLIAQIGGFVQSLVLVASVFVGIYNEMYYTIELANEIYDFDINYQDKKDKSKDKKDQDKGKLNNVNSFPGEQSEQNQIYKYAKMFTKKFNEQPIQSQNSKIEQPASDINSLDSPKLYVTQNPNLNFNQKVVEKDFVIQNEIPRQINDLNLFKSEIDQNIVVKKSYSGQILNGNTQSIKQKNLRFGEKIENQNKPKFAQTSKIQKSVIVQFKEDLNQNAKNGQISNEKQNQGLSDRISTNIYDNKNTGNVGQDSPQNDEILEQDESIDLKKESIQFTIEEKSKVMKPIKTYFTQRSKTQTKDILKYSTANPYSISQIDKKMLSSQNNQGFELKVMDRQNSHEDLKNLNVPLSPMMSFSNPRLLSMCDKPQNEQANLFFLDSSIEPESDIEISDSPERNRKLKNPIFHTIQPNSKSIIRGNQFEGKKMRSFSEINIQCEDPRMKQDSFRSLKNQKQMINNNQNNQKNDQKQKFFDAYKEEMRKDFMTKQLQKVLSKRQKLNLSLKYFVYKLSCGKIYSTKENMLIDKANTFLQQDIDIIVILNKIKELEKLKCLLLDQSQLALFNYFPKPLLQVDKNKNIVNKQEILKEVKQLERKMRTLDIKPQHISIVKKAKNKFKNLITKKENQQELFRQTDLLVNLDQHKYKDYQRLYKAYESIINKEEYSRMDKILIHNLGEETKQIFQNSINMKFGMDKLQTLMSRQYDKSQNIYENQQKKLN